MYQKAVIIILLFANSNLLAQEGYIIDSVEFCSKKIAVPDTCLANTRYSVEGKDWSIEWSYNDKLKSYLTKNSYADFAKKMGYVVTRKNARFIINDKDVEGSIFKLTSNNESHYMVYASTKSDKRLVVVLLSLKNYPTNNNSIPDFPKNIIKLSE